MASMINGTVAAFWAIGVLNNMPYVIMLAGAKNISEGGTALVFLANIVPGLLLKLSSPYWFDKVSYSTRMQAGSILMGSSFVIVAWFSYLQQVSDYQSNDRGGLSFYVVMQLLGVALGSAQGSLGEASLLALSGKADSAMHQRTVESNDNGVYHVVGEDSDSDATSAIVTDVSDVAEEGRSMCIAAFSSGTGLAGVTGFAFVFICNKVFGFSLPGTLVIAMIFPILYWIVFVNHLAEYSTMDIGKTQVTRKQENETANEMTALSSPIKIELEAGHLEENEGLQIRGSNSEDKFWDNEDSHAIFSIGSLSEDADSEIDAEDSSSVPQMSARERFCFTLSLWPYMIPLFTVYAAEYALQSGVWTSIGFPVDDEAKRDSFYLASNWMYQGGVFMSRSSGAFFTAPLWMLWLMPVLQTLNLVVFYFIATYHFWYNYSLLFACFYVGLLGGSVYVHAYTRICKDLPVAVREFALATASVADGFGIVLADISGLFIQSCLYRSNGINGAVVSCPL